MATAINTYQCPACTGPLHFAAGSGKLECEYCGSSYEVAEVEAFYAKKNAPAEPKLTCPACNAALNSEGMSGETTCPGCGAQFQMEDLRAYAAQMAEKHEDNITGTPKQALSGRRAKRTACGSTAASSAAARSWRMKPPVPHTVPTAATPWCSPVTLQAF